MSEETQEQESFEAQEAPENSENPAEENTGSEETASEQTEEAAETSGEERKDDREMFKATCTECNKECEVPFKPEGDKPVRCQDCYRQFRQRRPRRDNNNFNRGPRRMHSATCAKCNQQCEVPFKPTEGKPVLCLDCYRKSKA